MAVAFRARPSAPLYPVALPNVREDAERRARGVSIADWLEAPRPPATVAECEDNRSGCPALRCQFHLGRVGQRAGFSCQLDIEEMADDDRTFDLIGRVLGVSRTQAMNLRDSATRKVRDLDDDTLARVGVSRELARRVRDMGGPEQCHKADDEDDEAE